MKNKTAKTKIIILSIIAILVILLVGFLVYRNKNKEEGSNLFSDIFSILPSSRDATEVEAIAGVAIQKNEPVYVSGVSEDGRLIVSPYRGDVSSLGEIYGYATKDFSIGDVGEYELNNNYKYGHGNTTEIVGTIDYKFECSDGTDNDGDGYIDADDPNCHAEGDINKEYLPNYYSEETTIKIKDWTDPKFPGGTDPKFPGGTDPKFPDGSTPKPKCSDGIDNDDDGDIDADDSACHLDGDINKEYLPNHFSESQYVSSYIDLTAGNVTYQKINLDEPSTFYATITNQGTNKITEAFNSFFSIKKVGEDVEDIKTEIVEVPPLDPNSDFVISMSFSVPADTDKYKIRVCADKKDASDEGKIEEFNEENNCGSWVSFKADTSITPPDKNDLPECSDTIDNDGDGKIDREDEACYEGGDLEKTYLPNYDSESVSSYECSDTIDNDGDGKIDREDPACLEGGIPGGRYLPNYNSESMTSYECNDTIDNDGDGKIDKKDEACHEGGTLSGDYVPTNDSEEIAPAKPNICLSLEPLEFTDEEKAKLDDLLRRFYLIAPELKDETNIKMVYQEIERYSGFKNEIQVLIDSCYTETDKLKEEGYKDLIIQFGNPWYNYHKRGSYLEKIESEEIEKLKPQCVYSEEYEGIANADLFETYNIENNQQKISLCNSLGETYQSRSMCEYYDSNSDIGYLVRGEIAEGLRRLWSSIFNGGEAEPSFYMTGCKWINDDRVDLKEYEILLNVW
ncbi:MAG TPA: CARDB domain-containing protein [Candidatus Paceibacterota bacterium]|nr:CARDB domain-containing protein [Candidatus Paceibacterota bacterium]